MKKYLFFGILISFMLFMVSFCQAQTQEAFTQAVDLFNKGDIQNAIQQFEAIVKQSPDNADAHAYLGMLYNKVGNYTAAIKSFNEVIRFKPEDVGPYFNLGLAYFYKGMADEAGQQFNNVVKMAPSDTNWNKQAQAYISQIEQKKKVPVKEFSYSIFTNLESDSNVAYSSTPTASDADRKFTLFGSVNYRPVINGKQDLKIGYSYYNLAYGTHTTSNFLGNMGEVSYNLYPFANSLLALKANLNLYNLAASPYLFNLPIDCRLTFKVLPGAGAWSIAYVGVALDNYLQSTYEKQNANSMLFGLKQFLTENLSVGFEGKRLTAKGSTSGGKTTDDYSYQSQQLNINYVSMLPSAFSLSLDGSISIKNYVNVDSGTISSTPTKRADNLLTLSATLSKTLFWELGLMLKANYLANTCNLTASQSTIGTGSYASTAFSLGLSKAF